MTLTRKMKEELVANLDIIVKNAQSIAFVNFKNLNVEKANLVRKELREADIDYLVAKKTLIKRALVENNVEGEMPSLEGEIALVYSDKDLITPAREIYSFQKKESTIFTIVGGVFDGRYMDKEEMTEIASIPPQPVLYGQFVNLINSPIQGLVVALDKIAEKKEQKLA